MSILKKIGLFNKASSGHSAFKKLSKEWKEIVFYAESKHDWSFFAGIINELTKAHKQKISYLTSSEDDPLLTNPPKNLQVFYIGAGAIRTSLFRTIDCNLFVMTLPDLNTFYLKRSVNKNVHYVYIFHSMASTVMLYRDGAFDAYDTILTVGPHQDQEIRKREKMLHLKPKQLLPHGYHRLDKLIAAARSKKSAKKTNKQPLVLIASSWGESSITNRCAKKVTQTLLDAKFKVIYRPHPMSQWHDMDKIKKIEKEFSKYPDFTLDLDIKSTESIERADMIISEWSGTILEYAFANECPVISIDTPKKVNNPGYKKLGIEPLEVWIREEIGHVVSENKLNELPAKINDLLKNKNKYKKRIAQIRNKWIYNVGKSDKAAAKHLLNLKNKR